MSTYASEQDVANYIEGWVTTDPFALERLIQRAEKDLDILLIRLHTALPPTQVISIPGATSGQFALSWMDYKGVMNTANLPWNVSAAAMQAAIQAFPAVGADVGGMSNVAVLGSNPYTVVWSSEWARTNYLSTTSGSIQFSVPLISIDTSGLTPGGIVPSVVQIPGRKINPLTDLDENSVLSLANATCAQVEYRNAMGEAFFVRPQFSSVKGPDFTTEGKMPMIAPKAKRELTQTGLIQWSGRAVSGAGRRGIAKGWPTY